MSAAVDMARTVLGLRAPNANPIREDYDQRRAQTLADAVTDVAVSLSTDPMPSRESVRAVHDALCAATDRLRQMEREAAAAKQVSDWYQARVRQVESEHRTLQTAHFAARLYMDFLEGCDSVAFTRRGHTILTSGDGLVDAIADERAGDQRAHDAREASRRMTAGT